ncbi:MAG: hypothetical protein V1660_00285 [archaeon]
MKKRSIVYYLLFASTFIILMGTVAAADIIIGKYKYPPIIIIPIVSIGISIIILLVLIVKAARRNKQAIFDGVMTTLKVDKKKLQKSIKKSEKHDKEKEISYLTEIKRFKRHINEFEPEKAFEIISKITKNFFKELLGLKYEFTYNELVKELKNKGKRKELIEISERFSQMKYGEEKVSKEELIGFADELERILKREKRNKEENELGLSKAFQQKKGVFRNLSAYFRAMQEDKNEKERKNKILELMKEEEYALQKDMDIAKDIYHKLLQSYYRLPPDERKEVYEKLTKFYNNINSMLFSSIYGEKSKKQLEYFASKLTQIKQEEEKSRAIEKHEVKKHKPLPIVKEKPQREADLKQLDIIEQSAKDRIKMLGEAIVRHSIEKNYDTKINRDAAKIPSIHHQNNDSSDLNKIIPENYRKPIQTIETINLDIPSKQNQKPKHVHHLVQHKKQKIIPPHQEKHTVPAHKPKTRKIQRIDKETQAIKNKLSMLGQ